MWNFQKFSNLRPRSKSFTKETSKPTGVDMKIQRGKVMNILRRRKNMFSWLWISQRGSEICSRYQELEIPSSYLPQLLAKGLTHLFETLKSPGVSKLYVFINTSTMIENRTQNTNHKMNNAVEIQIYLKKSQNIYLNWVFDIICETIVSLSPRLVYPLTIIRQEKLTVM